MKKLFTEHPHSIGETYFEHMKFAFLFGCTMLIGALSCFTHAVFPFLCKNTGSNYLFNMMQNFVERMPANEKRVCGLFEVLQKKRNEADSQ